MCEHVGRDTIRPTSSMNRFLNVTGEADVSRLKVDCPLLRMVNVGGTARCLSASRPICGREVFVYACHCEEGALPDEAISD